MSDVQEMLRRHAERVETVLEEMVPKNRDDYLSDGVWYQFDSGGKRLRPALCLMSAEILGADPDRAAPFALACEILHNFLLIHDDIEDGDRMRRDKPTLWVEFGVPNAINVSDYLIARAYSMILNGPLDAETNRRLGSAYSFAFERTVEGQALDINLRGDDCVDLATYYKIVTHKTAFYLALPWVGAAIMAGVSDADLEGFWELGRCMGPAFQIRDDIIDLTEGKGRGGEVGCDIREGKPSIFVAYCLERKTGTDDDRSQLLDIIRRAREETTDADIQWTIDFFRETGALDFAQAEAQRFVDRTGEVLDGLAIPDDGKARFRDVARFVIDRKM
ncbi:MAG: polyprenyl synthetase family protein [Planctomycetota bacterium]